MSFSCQMIGKEPFQKKFKKKKVIFGVKSIKRERSIVSSLLDANDWVSKSIRNT